MAVPVTEPVSVPAGGARLSGDLARPERPAGVVLFAHGSGSGRHSPRNRAVAARLNDAGLATLLIDLLTADEEAGESAGGRVRFDVGLLARRLIAAIDWLAADPRTAGLPVGLFGASTGAAAALCAAAERQAVVGAVVSRGGRPDLAGEDAGKVHAATLLIVGGDDGPVIGLNEAAFQHLLAARERQFVVVPGAGHLFEEPGTLDEVARLAADWFARHLGGT